MRTFQNWPNKLHGISDSEKIASPRFHAIPVSVNNCWNKQNQETARSLFLMLFKIFQYFGLETFSGQDMKRCNSQKKRLHNYLGF